MGKYPKITELLLALIPLGFVAIVGASAAAYFLKWGYWLAWGAGIGAGITFFLWLGLLAWWKRLYEVDHGITTPEVVYPVEQRVSLAVSWNEGHQGAYLDLPVDLARLHKAARRILDGASFSHAGLAGPHRPLSRAEFEALRDEFIARGLAFWVNPEAHNQGVVLGGAGRALIRRLAGAPDPTSPTLSGTPRLPPAVEKTAYTHMHTRDGKEVTH